MLSRFGNIWIDCTYIYTSRGGSTENRTIPTYPYPRNKFCRLENVLVTRVTKNRLATSLYGRHEDFGCYVGNKLVASHAQMRLKQVHVAQERGQKQYLHCGHYSGKSTDAAAQDRSDGVGGVDAVRDWEK